MQLCAVNCWLAAVALLTTAAALENVSSGDHFKEKEPIYLLTLLPYPDLEVPALSPTWAQGANILPALDLALEQINNRTNLLPDHELRLIHDDGGCEILAKTSVSFVRNVFEEHNDKKIVGLVGPGCSVATTAISALTARPELSLVNVHDAGTPQLSNATRYPYSLGIFGSTRGFVDSTLALMKKNNWRKIAVLYQYSRTYYHTTLQQFESSLKAERLPGAKILISEPITTTFYPLSDVRNSGARIILALAAEEHLLRMICLAYHESMLFPSYQWLMPSNHFDTLLRESITLTMDNVNFVKFFYNGKRYNCSRNIILNNALNGSFLMDFRLTALNKTSKTDTGFTFEEFDTQYKQRVQKYNNNNTLQQRYGNITATFWAHNIYDAVWVWASVLDKLVSSGRINVSDIRYGNVTFANLILEEFFKTKFNGMSGRLSFNKQTRFVDRIVDLYQVLNGNETLVAYSNGSNFVPVPNVDIIAIKDSLETTLHLAHIGLVVFFAIILSIQLVIVAITHTLTIVYRKYKTVKASSIRLNQLIYIGVYLSVIGLLLFLIAELLYTSRGMCQAIWAWVLPISFTLVFGTLVARTWRLYRIFTHYIDPGPFLSDPVLMGFVCVLLLVDVIIATTWSAVDPLRLVTVKIRQENERELTTQCWCKYYSAWQATVLLYKAFLMIAFLTLAHLTGGIKNQSFTTASLRILGYTKFILYALGVPMYAIFSALSHSPNVDFSIFAVLVSISITLLVVFIFLPPLLPLLQEKRHSIVSHVHALTVNSHVGTKIT